MWYSASWTGLDDSLSLSIASLCVMCNYHQNFTFALFEFHLHDLLYWSNGPSSVWQQCNRNNLPLSSSPLLSWALCPGAFNPILYILHINSAYRLPIISEKPVRVHGRKLPLQTKLVWRLQSTRSSSVSIPPHYISIPPPLCILRNPGAPLFEHYFWFLRPPFSGPSIHIVLCVILFTQYLLHSSSMVHIHVSSEYVFELWWRCSKCGSGCTRTLDPLSIIFCSRRLFAFELSWMMEYRAVSCYFVSC